MAGGWYGKQKKNNINRLQNAQDLNLLVYIWATADNRSVNRWWSASSPRLLDTDKKLTQNQSKMPTARTTKLVVKYGSSEIKHSYFHYISLICPCGWERCTSCSMLLRLIERHKHVLHPLRFHDYGSQKVTDGGAMMLLLSTNYFNCKVQASDKYVRVFVASWSFSFGMTWLVNYVSGFCFRSLWSLAESSMTCNIKLCSTLS